MCHFLFQLSLIRYFLKCLNSIILSEQILLIKVITSDKIGAYKKYLLSI
jgi:hypothetical protein